jgi:hypothetical protein
LAVYLSAAAISLVALVLGAGICRLLRVAEWLAPTLGLSAAMLIVLVAIRLPGEIWAAVAALAGALILAGAMLLRGGLDAREVRTAALIGIPVGLVLLGACSLPFVEYGRVGELGPGFNPDPFFHMGQADAMRAVGLDARVTSRGYPIGPHALVATVATGLGIGTAPAFVGLLLAIPVLTGLTALAALRDLPPWRRILAASLVGLPYLPAAYFSQGSFKEPILASCFLACTLTVREARNLARPDLGALAAIVLAGAGGAVAFGWPAFTWPAALLVVYAVLAAPRDAVRNVLGRPGARRRAIAVAVVAAVAAAGLVVAAQASGFFGGAGKYLFAEGAGGNFQGQLSPFEAVGIWPSSDFRTQPESQQLLFTVVVALGVGVAAWGIAWCWRRGDRALLAGAIAGLMIYAIARPFTLAYNSGKALVVVAPLLTLIAMRALLAGWPAAAAWTPRRVTWIAVVVAFVAATAGSTAIALRAAVPRPHEVSNDLSALVPLVRGEPTLYLGRSHWIGWDLRAARLWGFQGTVTPLARRLREQGTKAPRHGQVDLVDVDSIPAAALDRFTYIVAPRTAYGSTLPDNFRPVRRTRWYVLWKRHGRTAPRVTLDENSAPGGVLSCDNPLIAALIKSGAVAFVRPRPVTGAVGRWRASPGTPDASAAGSPGAGGVPPGASLFQTLDLGHGTWELALSYSSGVALRVRAGPLDAVLPAYVEDTSRLFAVGRIVTSAPHTRVRVQVTPANRLLVDRWMQLGMLVATRLDDRGEVVPLGRACGRYVDWLQPRG